MAREVQAVLRVMAPCEVLAPVHVGAAATSPGADAPVSRDARGRVVVPGTGLAGALRAAVGHSELAGTAWGGTRDAGAAGPADGASRVVVHDAAVVLPGGQELLARRDGVVVDRRFGGAADGLLHGREVVPVAATVVVELELHTTAAHRAADLHLLGRLRAELEGGLRVGARTARGLGLLRARSVEVTEVRYDDPAAYWRTRRAPQPVPVAAVPAPAVDRLVVEVRWRPDGPLAVGTPGRTARTRSEPLLEPDPSAPDRLRLVLPGTSLAGALRSRAELVCRTLAGTALAPDDADPLMQLRTAPLAAELFGLARGEGPSSAVHVDDCASTHSLSAAEWAAVAAERTGYPRRVAAGSAALVETDHVAVDRWTGGAADGRLFADWEPHGVAFEPIRVTLHRDRLPPERRDAATMLLLVTLRELADGRVPVGGRTTRGYGRVEVTGCRIAGTGVDLTADGFPDLLGPPFAQLRDAWQGWVLEVMP